jgi:microcin C transport system permease protein
LLLMIPTLLGIMLISFVIVQFAPGGPVERVLAQLQGDDASATARIAGGRGRGFRRGRAAAQPGGGDGFASKYRGAQGLDPAFIKQLEAQFGFDQPGSRALSQDAAGLCQVRLRQKLFAMCRVLQLIKEKLPVSMCARPVDDVDCLCDLHSARHPQERCATAAASIPGPRRW